ncbi:hypothetical protein GM31_23185 [Trabulsiella odontotermitis]|uniref:Uncharacterized protein n=1 Tax=Trabulsiella odontotermitis TaxID=379893 RepID=A0A0L0H411_9ENTR|nr:hypothetical protein GM31_23185 [Trabulsiella odontotermitis]
MNGVNGDVYVAATTKGIGFAGETVVVQGDTVGMARIHFTSGQHRFHLADKTCEYFIQLQRFCVTEFTGNAGPISQIVQPVSLLYQTSTKARCHITIQSPF